jgi:hypothetical protein
MSERMNGRGRYFLGAVAVAAPVIWFGTTGFERSVTTESKHQARVSKPRAAEPAERRPAQADPLPATMVARVQSADDSGPDGTRFADPAEFEPAPEAAAERDAKLAELRASGAGGGSSYVHAADVQKAWRAAAAREGITIKQSSWECYSAGCTVTVEHASLDQLERFGMIAGSGIATRNWKGAGFRSGAIPKESGAFEATWIFWH